MSANARNENAVLADGAKVFPLTAAGDVNSISIAGQLDRLKEAADLLAVERRASTSDDDRLKRALEILFRNEAARLRDAVFTRRFGTAT